MSGVTCPDKPACPWCGEPFDGYRPYNGVGSVFKCPHCKKRFKIVAIRTVTWYDTEKEKDDG